MLSLRNIGFTFGDNQVTALDGLSLDLEPGKLHAIIGENGAGKSTLARICTGHLKVQTGSLTLDGRPLALDTPVRGLAAGLALVPQHPRLAPGLSVWQNLALGHFNCAAGRGRFGRLRKGPLLASLEANLREWGIHLPLELPAGHLDAAHMHWAAIAEALLASPSILFLDEPSAPYSPQEVERLYRLLKRCTANGMCVAVITHRLQEVIDWADRVHVLRHGKLVAELAAGPKLDMETLLLPMFGQVEQTAPPQGGAEPSGDHGLLPGLEATGLRINDGAGRILAGLDFQARPGGITGLIGIKDQGLDILEDILAGVIHPRSGAITWNGQPYQRLRRTEYGYVPGKRFQRGIATGLTIADNISCRDRHWLHPANCLSSARWRAWQARSPFTLERRWSDGITTLSGGMIQRLIFERELANPVPRLVVCAEPYWGLDRHFQMVLRQRLVDLARAGAAVLILSSDLDEAMDIADRLVVIHHGQQVLERPRAGFDRDELARAMVHTPSGSPA